MLPGKGLWALWFVFGAAEGLRDAAVAAASSEAAVLGGRSRVAGAARMSFDASGDPQRASTASTLKGVGAPSMVECGFENGSFVISFPSEVQKERQLIDGTATILVGNGSAAIPFWYGRLGNNMQQVSNAILYCLIAGIPTLKLPSGKSSFGTIFDSVEEIVIRPHHNLHVQCTFSQSFFSHSCSGVNRKLMRTLMITHLAPLFTDDVQSACSAERKQPFPGLTIHLRSGDKLGKAMAYWLAPCSAFEKIIGDGGFRSVRIVTEPDLSHPCIKSLPTKLKSVSFQVQSESLAKDFCALTEARHLATSGDSTFSNEVALMNDELRALYQPSKPAAAYADCNATSGQLSAKSEPWRKTFNYAVETDLPWGGGHIGEYIQRVPIQAVSLANTCDEEEQAPIPHYVR